MLLKVDSYDHYVTADILQKYTQVTPGGGSGNITINAAVGARSTAGLRILASGASNFSGCVHLVPSMPAPIGDTLITGFRIRGVNPFTNIAVTTNDLIQVGSSALLSCRWAGSTQWWLRPNTDGTLSVFRGTTNLCTSSVALTQNVFSHFELRVVLHASTGTVTMKLNGVTVATFTGNTQSVGTAWNEIRLGSTSASISPGMQFDLDDFYLADGSGAYANTFLGDSRVDARYPTANGATRNWTPSTGTDDFAVVDETAPNGDTDYLTTAVVNNKVTMGFQDVAVVGANILGVQVVASIKKTDAGGAGHKAVVRLGGVDYLGTELGVAGNYTMLTECFPVRPSDNAPWTDADFNAAEFGALKSA